MIDPPRTQATPTIVRVLRTEDPLTFLLFLRNKRSDGDDCFDRRT